jgi:hypothetical protein
MDEKVKQLWDKAGGAAAMLGGMLVWPWALWALGRGRRNGDPLEEALDRSRGHHEKMTRARDLAEYGYARAGRMLALAGDVAEEEGRDGIIRGAMLYAACAMGVERGAADREAASSEAEDAWLAEHGAPQPAWSRTWVFAKSHLHEAQSDKELFDRVRAVFAEVEAKLRPTADARLATAEPASIWKDKEPHPGSWHIDFKEGRPFGDLLEAERAAVLRSRETWRVGDVMQARWSYQPPAPADESGLSPGGGMGGVDGPR